MSLIFESNGNSANDLVSGSPLTFARTTAGYNNEGTSFAIDTVRKQAEVYVPPFEFTTVLGFDARVTDGYWVYGLKNYNTVCKTSDGGKTFITLKTFDRSPTHIFVTSKGSVLVATSKTVADTSGEMWRKPADSSTFTKTIESGFLTDQASVPQWTGIQEVNGTIFVTEYKSTLVDNNARCAYVSYDDGKTFVKAYHPAYMEGRHSHCIVGTMEGVIQAYLVYGDTYPALMRLVDSGDGTWGATQVILPYTSMHPTSGVWVPAGNCILWGSDGAAPMGVLKQDLSDDSISRVLAIDVNRTDSTFYNRAYNFFGFRQVANNFYAAASSQSTGFGAYTGAWASGDIDHWTKIANIARATTDVIRIAGIDSANNVWFSAGQDSYYLPNVPIVYKQGMLLEKESGNVAGNNPTAQSTTVVDNTYNTDKWVGYLAGNCARWQNDTDPITAIKYIDLGYNLAADAVPGRQYVFNVRVKGQFGDGAGNNKGKGTLVYFTSRIYDNENGANNNEERLSIWVFPDRWSEYTMTVVATADGVGTPTATKTRARACLYAEAGADPLDAQFDILIDGVAFSQSIVPTEWHGQAAVRGHDKLSFTPATFPDSWTFVSQFVLTFGDYDTAGESSGEDISFIYLASVSEDADNYVAVVYDVFGHSFVLVNKVGGSATAAISSVVKFDRNQNCTISLSKSGTDVYCSIWLGGKKITLDHSYATQTFANLFWGSHPSGTQGGSIVLMGSRLYDTVLTADEVLAEVGGDMGIEYAAAIAVGGGGGSGRSFGGARGNG